MGERRLDDGPDVGDRRDRRALERDESGVDARPRTEHRRRHGVESDLPRAELNEDRDGAVRLRSRQREEAIGDLALHHDAPALERRCMLQSLDDERRRDVVREVGDELRGRGS